MVKNPNLCRSEGFSQISRKWPNNRYFGNAKHKNKVPQRIVNVHLHIKKTIYFCIRHGQFSQRQISSFTSVVTASTDTPWTYDNMPLSATENVYETFCHVSASLHHVKLQSNNSTIARYTQTRDLSNGYLIVDTYKINLPYYKTALK